MLILCNKFIATENVVSKPVEALFLICNLDISMIAQACAMNTLKCISTLFSIDTRVNGHSLLIIQERYTPRITDAWLSTTRLGVEITNPDLNPFKYEITSEFGEIIISKIYR